MSENAQKVARQVVRLGNWPWPVSPKLPPNSSAFQVATNCVLDDTVSQNCEPFPS